MNRLDAPFRIVRWTLRGSVEKNIELNLEPANIFLKPSQLFIDCWLGVSASELVFTPGSQLSALELIITNLSLIDS